MSLLKVYFQKTPCGTLFEDAGGVLQFQYLDEWVEENRSQISVRLPVSNQVYVNEQVAPFVASFLPEGESLRKRLEKLLHVDAENDFELLSVLGRESAGALSFWPEDEEPFAEEPQYDALGTAEFEKWKEYAHHLPQQFKGRTIRLSLAGAQSKTALFFNEANNPFLPEKGAPTTHILKPRMQGCQPSTVFVELLTMRVAQAVLGRARVPDTDLWQNCYRIRRFDRPKINDGVSRLHQEDFCLALGRMPNQKYESASPRERLLRYCFKLIDDLGEMGLIESPAIERLHLLDQVILNALLHNPDAHLKNYAFLYRQDGTLEIAPLYDSLCTQGMQFAAENAGAWSSDVGLATHTRELSLKIGNAVLIDQITLEDWEAFAIECGFTQAFVRRRIKSLAENIGTQFQAVVDSVLNEFPAAEPAANAVTQGVFGQINSVIVAN